MSKLETYGIRGLPLSLLKSYLTSRKQAVRIGDSLSSFKYIDIGVPQGSVLGPLIYYLYQ